MGNKTRIVIADDHPIFRRGLRAALEAETHLQVVAEAENGESAFAVICEHRPDIAILDLDLPKKDGVDVARAIQKRGLHTAVIILTLPPGESLFNAALDQGVNGYVLKDSTMSEIIDCVETVLDGRNYISPQLSIDLIRRDSDATSLALEEPGLKQLTPAEQHILKLIADGKTSRQIAENLHISIRTVDRHRSNICSKLDLHGSNALMKFALAHGSQLSRGWNK